MWKKIRITWQILPKKFKIRFASFPMLMIVGSLLEVLGLGLILPILTFLVGGEMFENFPIFNEILNYFDNPPHAQIVIYCMFLLTFVYLLKNLILALTVWIQKIFYMVYMLS